MVVVFYVECPRLGSVEVEEKWRVLKTIFRQKGITEETGNNNRMELTGCFFDSGVIWPRVW